MNPTTVDETKVAELNFDFVTETEKMPRSFVITDPKQEDNPIVFASSGFLKLSGYTLDEVLGKNCRFMQGPDTEKAQLDVLRQGIKDGVDTSVCVLNYKKGGIPFYNQVFVVALLDDKQEIKNYVGVQYEVIILCVILY